MQELSDVDVALLVLSLWASLPSAMLALLWREIHRNAREDTQREVAEGAGVAIGLGVTLVAEAWVYRPVIQLHPFSLVPELLFPVAAAIVLPVIYVGVKLTGSMLLRMRGLKGS